MKHDDVERLPDDKDLLSRELPAGQAYEAAEPGLVWVRGGSAGGGLSRLQGVRAGRVYGAVAAEGDRQVEGTIDVAPTARSGSRFAEAGKPRLGE